MENKNLLFIILCLFFLSCDPIDKRLTIINKTNDTLVAKLLFDNELPNNNFSNRDDDFLLLPNQPNKIIILNDWEEVFKSLKDSIINIFITKEYDYLSNNEIWDSLYVNKKFIRKQFSLNDFKNKDWQIVFDSEFVD